MAGSWAVTVAVRRSMQGNRRRDTAPELRLRRRLHAMGLRYRVDRPLEFDRRRRADLTFVRRRLVVFLDGCFWHGCPEHYVAPKSHLDYWSAKVARNAARDSDTTDRLRALGWEVRRYWEHQDLDWVAEDIRAAVVEPAPAETVGADAGPVMLQLPAAVLRLPGVMRRLLPAWNGGSLPPPRRAGSRARPGTTAPDPVGGLGRTRPGPGSAGSWSPAGGAPLAGRRMPLRIRGS